MFVCYYSCSFTENIFKSNFNQSITKEEEIRENCNSLLRMKENDIGYTKHRKF